MTTLQFIALALIGGAIGGALGLWLWCCFQLSLGLIEGKRESLAAIWGRVWGRKIR